MAVDLPRSQDGEGLRPLSSPDQTLMRCLDRVDSSLAAQLLPRGELPPRLEYVAEGIVGGADSLRGAFERGTADIMHLVEHFADLHGRRHGRMVRRIPRATQELLGGHSWPGNAREPSCAG